MSYFALISPIFIIISVSVATTVFCDLDLYYICYKHSHNCCQIPRSATYYGSIFSSHLHSPSLLPIDAEDDERELCWCSMGWQKLQTWAKVKQGEVKGVHVKLHDFSSTNKLFVLILVHMSLNPLVHVAVLGSSGYSYVSCI